MYRLVAKGRSDTRHAMITCTDTLFFQNREAQSEMPQEAAAQTGVELHELVKRSGELEKASVHGQAGGYAQSHRAHGGLKAMLPKYRIQSVPRGQTPTPMSSCMRKLASFSLHWSRSCSHRSELAVECWQHFGDQQLERGQVWLVPFALEQIPTSLVK